MERDRLDCYDVYRAVVAVVDGETTYVLRPRRVHYKVQDEKEELQ